MEKSIKQLNTDKGKALFEVSSGESEDFLFCTISVLFESVFFSFL